MTAVECLADGVFVHQPDAAIVTPRRQPDLELLARVIVDMAMTDPLGLQPTSDETAGPDLDRRDTSR